ncbi:MAG: hypothetical protein RMI34_11270 [Chloroherpetonaceae bacterium]|nr:hypothetical protein [Chloroherpetonaceae bacterium]MCS7211396.1 hypothetical protein [Chloroherpetonaceae bacterium]MDW8020642.1 hypothetical protein [Chloroherpetonaceae bacterium]MDW8465666.1 hypothetical protein [Chloroherpetonaceae bacterium]
MKRILFAVLMGSLLLFAATSASKATAPKSDKVSVVADSAEKKAEKKKGKKKKKEEGQ